VRTTSSLSDCSFVRRKRGEKKRDVLSPQQEGTGGGGKTGEPSPYEEKKKGEPSIWRESRIGGRKRGKFGLLLRFSPKSGKREPIAGRAGRKRKKKKTEEESQDRRWRRGKGEKG